jgi:hypothetical protein
VAIVQRYGTRPTGRKRRDAADKLESFRQSEARPPLPTVRMCGPAHCEGLPASGVDRRQTAPLFPVRYIITSDYVIPRQPCDGNRLTIIHPRRRRCRGAGSAVDPEYQHPRKYGTADLSLGSSSIVSAIHSCAHRISRSMLLRIAGSSANSSFRPENDSRSGSIYSSGR